MPRGRLGGAARRDGLRAMRFEQLCVDTRMKRRGLREQQRMDDMRRKTYGWTELQKEIEGLEIEVDMAEMELRGLNADRRKIGLAPVESLPSHGGLGDTRRPEDDWRNYGSEDGGSLCI